MILLLTETLTAGGAEIFVLRLARQLNKIGYKSIVFNYHKQIVNKSLLKEFDDIQIIHFSLPFDKIILKADRILLRLGIDFSFRQLFLTKKIRRIIDVNRIQVVHSHLFKVDYSFALINRSIRLRHVITNHGDYQLFHSMAAEGNNKHIIGFYKKAEYVFRKSSSIICISNKQWNYIADTYGVDLKNKMKIIYNGLTVEEASPRSKTELGLSENVFVFGMVARGIREKGWEFAISAFSKLENQDAHLVLVGEGDYLKVKREEIVKQKNIHWVGFSQNPLEWIALFNVGLLPSFYKAESQPNVILEYLSLGKPVISSDVGDVSVMLNIDNPNQCGFVIQVENEEPEIDVRELSDRMDFYINNNQVLLNHSLNALVRFKDFDMEKCAEKYINEYFPIKSGAEKPYTEQDDAGNK